MFIFLFNCVWIPVFDLSFRIGPMDVEAKTRKPAVRRRHVRPTDSSRPEEVIHYYFTRVLRFEGF